MLPRKENQFNNIDRKSDQWRIEMKNLFSFRPSTETFDDRKRKNIEIAISWMTASLIIIAIFLYKDNF